MNDPAETMTDGLCTIPEAMAVLKMSRSSIYSMMDVGEIAYVKIRRCRRIPRRAIHELIRRHLHEAVGDTAPQTK